jgi:glycosyltransferase involved in cell wall biosynthesis
MSPAVVTIVVPCFGQARFLRDALESALSQTYLWIEVVVVDDAAPDGGMAEAISREFGVGFVRTARTLGPGGARNAGIASGSGEYVLPLDADDILAPDYVERAVALLEGRPEAGVVYCKVQAFGTGAWSWEPPPGWSLRELIRANQLPNPSMYRRACWEEVGGYPGDMFMCEDWDFWIRVARRGWRFVRIPRYLVFCRQHSANLTLRLPVEYGAYCRRILARHEASATDDVVSFEVDEHASTPADGSR